jgi:hypothetical protein
VAVVQYTFTHKQYIERHKTKKYTEQHKDILEECGPCPVFAGYTLAFALQLRKNQRKTLVRVAEDCQLAQDIKRFLTICKPCGLYPGICFTTEEKAKKNFGQGSRRLPVGTGYQKFFNNM